MHSGLCCYNAKKPPKPKSEIFEMFVVCFLHNMKLKILKNTMAFSVTSEPLLFWKER